MRTRSFLPLLPGMQWCANILPDMGTVSQVDSLQFLLSEWRSKLGPPPPPGALSLWELWSKSSDL